MAAGCAACVAGDLCVCIEVHSCHLNVFQNDYMLLAGWVSFLFWNHDKSMKFHTVNGTFTLTYAWEIYLYVPYGTDVFVYNRY